MKTNCALTQQRFEIREEELGFYSRKSLPLPKLCPEERLRRRFAFRHGGNLYRTKCDATGEMIISMYPPERNFLVYEQKTWWSDSWDALDYGRDFDFSRPFFEQFSELYRDVPHVSLLNTNCENAYYTNHALNLRNCYLLVGAVDSEDAMYGYFIIKCKDVVDGFSLHSCELCYDGVSSVGCYHCISFANCRNCSDCILVEDCQSCANCIGCFGLRGKSYHILNQPVAKEDYERYKKELPLSKLGGLGELRARFDILKSSSARPAMHQYNSEDCTGDMLMNCKTCFEAYDCNNCEDCRYLAFADNSLASYDCCYNGGGGVQFSYECVSTLAHSSNFNAVVWHGSEVEYSMECHSCRNLFGCIGLRQAEFAIFNKKYSASEFHSLRKKIISHMQKSGEWGEFFPGWLSPFAYNDSIAQLFFPLTNGEAKRKGFRWRDLEVVPPSIATASVPNDIADATDELLEKAFVCESSGNLFRINRQELDFYRKMGLALPRLAPHIRHKRQLALRHNFKLFERKDVSGETIVSIYPSSEVSKVMSLEDWMNAN